MDDATLIPISTVMEQHSLKRPALYARMNGLGITPTKIGRNAFVTEAEFYRLEQLHDYLGRGGTIANFISGTDITERNESPGLVVSPSSAMTVSPQASLEMMAEILDLMQQPDPAQSLRSRLETLEQAAVNGWLLPSRDVAMLLGLGKLNYGPEFSRYGFVFTRLEKQGTEYIWRISKLRQ
ncbi:hypothetical protein [Synechococcus sp. PCC 6312]|uniref:hypothetical protein n=1 Tax=Synechococcus sp. (strain ATCC 27167 / PCC 6312) TaxID=195253 RepID=UPI00029EFA55|nr:hypothetical protein [Synechococcus sp. PCC 6312]AFY62784.1 hypothetical protein Syn6312_3774 [Synechococcus sp. PCC 6312]